MNRDQKHHLNGARSALSVEQALRLHDEFANAADLALNYYHDGCGLRTHLMGKHSDLKHINLKKAWAKANKPNYMHLILPDGFSQKWRYHVALAVPIRVSSAHKKAQYYIFDPMIFDGPVTMSQWLEKFAKDDSQYCLLPLHQRPAFSNGNLTIQADANKDTDMQAKQILKSFAKRTKLEERMLYRSRLKSCYVHRMTSHSAKKDMYKPPFKGYKWRSAFV